jgi:hypothetical protein
MKKLACLSILGAAFMAPAYACSPPPSAPAVIPDGKSASMDQMIATKREVDQFKKEMEAYLGCVKDAPKADFAQAELQRVATRFNAEVRAYKAANAGK